MQNVTVKTIGIRLETSWETQLDRAKLATGCGYTELVLECLKRSLNSVMADKIEERNASAQQFLHETATVYKTSTKPKKTP